MAKQKWSRETHSVTYVPGFSTLSDLSCIVAQPTPSFLYCPRPPLITPSIQPILGLPRNRPPLSSAINTLLAIRYSSILSTCPNHLNTLWSVLLANSLSIKALLRTSPFLTPSNRYTKLLKHIISRTYFFLSHHFSYTMPLLRTTPLVLLLLHIDTCWTLSPILYCSVHFSARSIPRIHSVYHIIFTSSTSSTSLRSQVLETIHFF